jgi:hypothetical protein
MSGHRTHKQVKAAKALANKERRRSRKEKKREVREAQFPDGNNPAGIRPRLIEARDIVDWLRCQENAPYPLETYVVRSHEHGNTLNGTSSR